MRSCYNPSITFEIPTVMNMKTLSPRDFAKAIGASESSVKRWVDDGAIPASRTTGGHRRIAVQDAIDYVRKHGIMVVRSDLLGLPEIRQAAGGDVVAAQLARALSEGQAEETRSLLLSSYMDGRTIASLCDGPIRDAMTRIGEMWTDDPRGVFIEHRATSICMEALDIMRVSIIPTAKGPQAVGAACSGDSSVLPSLMAATVLESEGFRAVNLGADTPIDAFQHAVEHHAPTLTWLSVNHLTDQRSLTRDLRILIPWLGERRVQIVIGGRSAREIQLPASGNLFLAESMGELAALARGIAAR